MAAERHVTDAIRQMQVGCVEEIPEIIDQPWPGHTRREVIDRHRRETRMVVKNQGQVSSGQRLRKRSARDESKRFDVRFLDYGVVTAEACLWKTTSECVQHWARHRTP